MRRYAAGEIDSLSDLPADQIVSLKSRFGPQVQLGPGLGLLAIAFNLRKKPFDDARVRRALSLAIDREFLAEIVWGQTMAPAYSFCRPASTTPCRPRSCRGARTGRSIARRRRCGCWQKPATGRATR